MNAANVSSIKLLEGTAKATAAKQNTRSSCEYNVQFLLVPIISTNGLHSGFIVQGIRSMLVYRAMLALSTPMSLYIISDIDVMAWYGSPEAK